MTNTWIRTLNVSNSWPVGYWLVASLPSAATLLRVHASYGVFGTTGPNVNMLAISQQLLAWGLVTTVGNGTETPPNARTQAADQSPPTQRWIYWETRALEPTIVNIDAGLVVWRSSSPEGPIDTKGQVLATGLPTGDTLNLWSSWAGNGAWDVSGSVGLWQGASVLYRDPGS